MLSRISRQLLSELGRVVSQSGQNFSSGELQVLLEAALKRLKLVTREEFDAQSKVLARTREKLEALEKQVALLEKSTSEESTSEESTSKESALEESALEKGDLEDSADAGSPSDALSTSVKEAASHDRPAGDTKTPEDKSKSEQPENR